MTTSTSVRAVRTPVSTTTQCAQTQSDLFNVNVKQGLPETVLFAKTSMNAPLALTAAHRLRTAPISRERTGVRACLGLRAMDASVWM